MTAPKDLILLSNLAEEHHIKPHEVLPKAALGIIKVYMYTFGNEPNVGWFEIPKRFFEYYVSSNSFTRLSLDTDFQASELLDKNENLFRPEENPENPQYFFRSPIRALAVQKKAIKKLIPDGSESSKTKGRRDTTTVSGDTTERGKSEILRKYQILCAALDLVNDALNNKTILDIIIRREKGRVVLNASTLASEICEKLPRWPELQARKEKLINSGLEPKTITLVLQDALKFAKKTKP